MKNSGAVGLGTGENVDPPLLSIKKPASNGCPNHCFHFSRESRLRFECIGAPGVSLPLKETPELAAPAF